MPLYSAEMSSGIRMTMKAVHTPLGVYMNYLRSLIDYINLFPTNESLRLLHLKLK